MAKGAAWRAWAKIKPPLAGVTAALGWQAKQAQWTKDDGAFVPHPSTYINQRRWEDAPPAAPAPDGAPGTVWPAARWVRLYARLWADKYCAAYSDAGDGKAVATLQGMIVALPPDAAVAAQARAQAMIADFLGDSSPDLLARRHPFWAFVGRWGGLRVGPGGPSSSYPKLE